MSIETYWRDFRDAAERAIREGLLKVAVMSPKEVEDVLRICRFGFFAGAHATVEAMLDIQSLSSDTESDAAIDELLTERLAWMDEVLRGEFKS